MVAFPLLLIPLAIVNIVVFLMPGLSLTAPLTSVTLKSGAVWNVTSGDALLVLAALLLLFEMVKAARPGAKSIVEMLLAILLCGGAIAEFVLLPPFATSVFFLLIMMTVIDVLGSFVIGRQSRRRPVRPAVATQPVVVPSPPVEPAIVPRAAEPSADSVVTSPVDVRREPVVPEELRTSPLAEPHQSETPAR